MKTLIDIYDFADNNGIEVHCYNLPIVKTLSYIDGDNDSYIAIDPFQLEDKKDEKVRLAHEMGHCVKGAFYNQHSNCDIIEKHEHCADRWAVEQLVPWSSLQSALESGIVEQWELADYFEVTEYFIHTAIEVYRRKGKL